MSIKLSEVKPSITIEKIYEVEEKIGHTFPQQYREFLLRNNGGRPKPSDFNIQWGDQEWAGGLETGMVHFFLSVHDGPNSNFLKYHRTFDGRIPRDTIAIASDPGGDLILLGTGESNEGKVFYWHHNYEAEDGEEPDYSNVGLIANSFNEFIDSLYDDEADEA